MKKISLLLILCFCLFACSEEEKNLIINGKVEGLKKGTIFLQKIDDTTLVTIDSVIVEGNPSFSFATNIEGSRVLYLYLEKLDGTQFNDRILFFAEPGEMTINTTLKNFVSDAVIEGSENQEKLTEYRKILDRFNVVNLELIKQNLEAQKEEDQELISQTAQKYDDLIKRKYLYTLNFALNNKDLEIAPYLAISEVYDANIKYLDTIYNSLSPEVRDSRYGKSLGELLEEREEIIQQKQQEEPKEN